MFYVVSTASLCAVLFGSALAGERFVRFMTHPAARFAAPALTTGGTLLLASSAAGTGAALSFGILGAITTGIGSGLIDLGYGELYRNEPPARATFEWMLRLFDERNAARTMPSATPTKHAHTPMRQAKDFRSKSMGNTLARCLRDQACSRPKRIHPEMAGKSEQTTQPAVGGSAMTRENTTAARKKARGTSKVWQERGCSPWPSSTVPPS